MLSGRQVSTGGAGTSLSTSARRRGLTGVGVAADLGGMPVLLITRSPSVHDSVVPLCAAAGVGAEVCAEPSLSLAAWREADLVLVGDDLAGALVGLAPVERRVSTSSGSVSATPPSARRRAGRDVGGRPAPGEGWLSDELSDVGERASPGRLIGVVGGAGGAGATTLACALAQWHAARASTLLVDGDPLGPGLDRLLGMEDAPACGGRPSPRPPVGSGARALREGVPRRDQLGVLTWSGLRRRLDVATVRRVLLAAAVLGHDLVVARPRPAGRPADWPSWSTGATSCSW